MKRILILMLALLMLLSAFASCQSNKEADSEQAVSNEASNPTADSSAETEEEPYELPERSYDGEKLDILIPPGKIWQFEEHSVNPSILNTTLFERNTAVEFAYDVELNYVYRGNNASQYNELLNGEMLSQSGAYDLCFYPPDFGMIGMVVKSNYFIDLMQSEYIDFSHEWWGGDLNDVTIINGKTYGAIGYGSIELMSAAKGIFYNKTIFRDVFQSDPDELYDTVRDGRWTLDEMKTMAATATSDLDGDLTMTEADRYGFGADINAAHLFYSLGAQFIVPDETEGYKLDFNNERNVNAFRALYVFLNGESFRYIKEGFLENAKAFNESKILFSLNTFDNGYRIQKSGVNYGILPLPKYNAEQPEYITCQTSSYYSIPTTVDDQEFSEIMLNAFHYYSYQILRPKYHETVLQVGVGRQPEDAEMIDLIFDSLSPDFSFVFRVSFSNFHNALFNKVINKDNSYASYFKENQELFQTQLEKILKENTEE